MNVVTYHAVNIKLDACTNCIRIVDQLCIDTENILRKKILDLVQNRQSIESLKR